MNNLKIINGFLLTPDVLTINTFEELYNAVELAEGKTYTEREIAKLPVIGSSHPYNKEWLIRGRSCKRLLRYIKQRRHICNILEIGCGNGWLAAQMASVTRGNVTGLDINTAELDRAKKTFGNLSNLKFAEGDIRSGVLADEKFDLVVFAASVEYFRSLQGILKTAVTYLTLQGEIHIMDTRLYQPYEIAKARQKSKKYFTDIGFPGMAHLYFHHCIHEIESFRFSILYNPNSWINKFSFRRNPFYWLAIKNHHI